MPAGSGIGVPVQSAGNFAELMGAASKVPGALEVLMQQFAKRRAPKQYQNIGPQLPMYRPGREYRAAQRI